MTKAETEANEIGVLLAAVICQSFAHLEVVIKRGGVWVVDRGAWQPLSYGGRRMYIAGRHIYGEPTKAAVPFRSGYELLGTRGGYNFPHIAGPFKGRGWLNHLVAAASEHAAKVPHV